MIIYSGKKINVRKDEVLLEDGRKVTREVIDHPGSAAVIPFITQDEIILLHQYRHPVKETLYEIPAGTLDKGETFFACAKRELEEETGYWAGALELLMVLYPSPGILNETMHLFKATNLVKTQTNYQLDESIKGNIHVKLSDAVEMIKKGTIRDAKTVCSVLWCSR
ncbi:ADP-ribose pyrophosphatase [Candidatus Brocadiaceae bacterium B188]|nr:NUDIX hydrolase [Candidatus Brocadia sapporoensis]MEB2308629.1 NUDIX hydrolase [Candidatus Brocadiaceae bacterium]QQR67476.1 MAG: NUDIX hydrolase [Candidatus Brocadia sp.]RZV56787.1 MAG: NUDIX hydrolase [Candidatus Brocadia sp. BROELEC01]TWU52284.1 ADP-ribose pyrophosphatase [Candidatus Brocadiaceae bacterium B188]